MRKALIAATIAASLLASPTALACVPVVATDPQTGATYMSGSAEWLRRVQAGWREQSEVVVVAQAREGRMIDAHDVEFVLLPFATVYGGDLPNDTFRIRWHPGDTCNRLDLTVSSLLIVFVGTDGEVVGFTTPSMLQDRPADFSAKLRASRPAAFQ